MHVRVAPVFAAGALLAPAAEWPRFRGLNGTSVIDSRPLPDEFAPGKDVAFHVPVRRGLGGRGDVTKTHVIRKYEKSLPNIPSPLSYKEVLNMLREGGILTALI